MLIIALLLILGLIILYIVNASTNSPFSSIGGGRKKTRRKKKKARWKKKKKKKGKGNSSGSSGSSSSNPGLKPDPGSNLKPGSKFIVLYEFNAEDEGEISVKKDEIVTSVPNNNPEGWIIVRKSDNVKGYVPRDYIQEI